MNWLLIGMLACIPTVQSALLADPTLLPRQFAASLLVLFALLWAANNKSTQKFQIPVVALSGLLLWWVATGLSLTVAPVIQEGLYTFSKLSWFVAAVFIFYVGFSSGMVRIETVSIGIWMASVIGLLLLLSEAFGQHLLIGDRNQLYELRTAFGHKNLYASFQLLCMPFVLGAFLHAGKTIKYLAGITLLLVLASILYVQSRAAWLGLMAAVFTYISMRSGAVEFVKSRKTVFRVVALILVISIAIACLAFQRAFVESAMNSDSLRERILLWKNTLEMIKEHPWMGVGAGNWQILFPKYGLGEFLQTNYLISDGYTTFQRPHNDFLWVWSEAGIAGILGMLIFMLYPLTNGLLAVAKHQDQKRLLLPVAFVTGYLFVAFMDFPLERNEHQFLLALLIAWVLHLLPNQKVINADRKSILFIAFCMVLFSLFIVWKRYPNEVHAKKMIEAHLQGNWDKLIQQGKKIDTKWYAVDNFSIPVSWYEGVALFSKGNAAEAAVKFETAYQINPWQVHVLNNMASIHELQGKHLEALKYYDALLAISPFQPDALLNKSAVLFNTGRNEDAFRCIYKFKYDDHNEQFLTYLHAIGKAVILERQSAGRLHTQYTPEQLDANPDIIRKILRANQQKRTTFEEINFTLNE